MTSPKRVLALALIAAPLALASSDAPATTSYALPSLCTPTSGFKNGSLVTSGTPSYATASCAGNNQLTSVSAWSDTGTSGKLQSAYIGDYGSNGLGVTSTGPLTQGTTDSSASGSPPVTITTETTVAPDHAMDDNGNKESILLSFNTAVSLTSFQIGYSNTDSDMSVLRYTGTGCSPTCSSNLSTLTYSALTNSGWAVVGNYANVATNTPVSVAAPTVTSSYWLIAAYNSVFGTGTNLGDGNDYVKLLSVTTDIPAGGKSVPEPSSVLLVGIAIAGLAASRKRLGLTH